MIVFVDKINGVEVQQISSTKFIASIFVGTLDEMIISSERSLELAKRCAYARLEIIKKE